MKIKLLTTLLITGYAYSQSAVQTVNSGSLLASATSVSVGEIILDPVGGHQSSSGIIGLLVQIDGQVLQTPSFAVSETVTVFPNPTKAQLYFAGKDVSNQSVSVYDNSGKRIVQTRVAADQSVNLEGLPNGIFQIRLQDESKIFTIIKQ